MTLKGRFGAIVVKQMQSKVIFMAFLCMWKSQIKRATHVLASFIPSLYLILSCSAYLLLLLAPLAHGSCSLHCICGVTQSLCPLLFRVISNLAAYVHAVNAIYGSNRICSDNKRHALGLQ